VPDRPWAPFRPTRTKLLNGFSCSRAALVVERPKNLELLHIPVDPTIATFAAAAPQLTKPLPQLGAAAAGPSLKDGLNCDMDFLPACLQHRLQDLVYFVAAR
jgi:hypothetical protein